MKRNKTNVITRGRRLEVDDMLKEGKSLDYISDKTNVSLNRLNYHVEQNAKRGITNH